MFVQVGVKLLNLLLGYLYLFQASLDLGNSEETSFLPLGDHRTQLVEFDDRRLIAQQNDLINAHSP